MAYILDGLKGRRFKFKSEQHYRAARKWWNSTTQLEAIAWAEKRGLKLRDETGQLDPEWVLAA